MGREGEENCNKYGTKMWIVEYNGCHDIVVEFENGYKTKANYQSFKDGSLKNPYNKTVCGVGFLGEGKYSASEIIGDKWVDTLQYKYWHNLLIRCYNLKHLKKRPTYEGCIVCEDWLNFQNFAKWFDENYYTIGNKSMQLDKDILIKNNKKYSAKTSIFVPQNVNVLFTKRQNYRGAYPIGVSFDKDKNKFRAYCSNGNKKKVHLGFYKTPKEAFNIYKEFKENYIKEVADLYRDKIPNKLYKALHSYEVEETD